MEKKKSNSCQFDLSLIPAIPTCQEDNCWNPLMKIKFNTKTKEVFDEFGNLIGTGELCDGILKFYAK